MECAMFYHTRKYLVFFEITATHINATIYNKDVGDLDEWEMLGQSSCEKDLRSDFSNCRKLLKSMRKNIS